ncbi:MAG: hypothetical protein K0R65_440 [Crocinitomicaceae bacterium]|jgi:hypothetical protein|nr:hypothetical protein [Crocinitomicaceae bacterium]
MPLNQKLIAEETIHDIIASSNKPTGYSNFPYPLNSLDDRVFEVLTYSIFKKRIENDDIVGFDNVQLMQGVGEKGMDCILTSNSKVTGIIQCKKYSKNISHEIILEEIIKFSIHCNLDKKRFNPRTIKYFISTSTGYTGKAIELLEHLADKSFIKRYNIQEIANKIIKKYKEFQELEFVKIKSDIIKIVSELKYEYIKPENYDVWINKYADIIDTFFDVKIVMINNTKELLDKMDSLFSKDENKLIKEFIERYKITGIEKLNVINFIGFDLHKYMQKPGDITLTELFVKPLFTHNVYDKKEGNKTVKNIELAQLFERDKNFIILGDPGAGKSLLIKYIIVEILNKNHLEFIPFRIELRKYNEVRENKSIIEYLAENITREYHIQIDIDLLTKVIKNYKTLFFFDGLDEIFNITHKNKMKESIESFSLNYANSKSIITSRFIGYHDINFSQEKYNEFSIQKFNQTQIEELVRKFFLTQNLNKEKQKKSIEDCLLQIQKDVDEDLKTNPLIMTLILILSSNNIVIPDSKLEIYEACTKTLVDTIDIREKELKFELPVKNKRLTFAHLAYWQYQAITDSIKISYDKAVRTIANLLLERKEAQEYTEAEEKAKKFLEYAEKRSIYFEDNFTHKTFLEYYTADYLYINYFTKANDQAKQAAIGLISKYLSNSFWYIVFELLFTRIDKDQADSELLDEIFVKQIESNSLNAFYFLISNLPKLINIGDDIKKDVIRKTIHLCIQGQKMSKISHNSSQDKENLFKKIILLQKNHETSNLFQQVLLEFEDLKSEKELIEFYIWFHELLSIKELQGLGNLIEIKNERKLLDCALKDILLYSLALISLPKKPVTIKILLDQIDIFGVESIFKDIRFRHMENVSRINTFCLFMRTIAENKNYTDLESAYENMIKRGVKHEEMIKQLKALNGFYDIDGLFELFLISENKKIDEIIIAGISIDQDSYSTYEDLKLSTNNKKLDTIEHIFEERNKQNNDMSF